MLTEAQKIINTRPLMLVRAGIEDCDVISPSSLLHHHSVKPMNPIGTLPSRENLIMDHQNVQERVYVFWGKWVSIYLHYLQKRHKQRIKQKNFLVGNLVLLMVDPSARVQYPLTLVVEVHPDGDGSMRHMP